MFSYRKEEKVNDDHYDRQFYDFFILRQNGLTADNSTSFLGNISPVFIPLLSNTSNNSSLIFTFLSIF